MFTQNLSNNRLFTILLILFLWGSVRSSFVKCQNITNNGTSSFQNSDGSWVGSWLVSTDTITVTFSGQTRTGWVGFGINDLPQMVGADVIVGWIDGIGNATLTDRTALQQSQPVPDTDIGGQNDILNYTGFVETINGQSYLTFTFTRQLIVNDPHDISITPNATLFLLWAIGPEGGVNYGTGNFLMHRARGVVAIDFFNGCVPKLDTNLNDILRKVHAILMTLGWTIFAFGGSFIARYMKTIGPLWFKLHILMEDIGVACILTAFIIIQYNLRGQVIGVHQLIGLFTVIGLLAQPLLGILADRLYKPDRKKPPCFPDMVHWYLGRIVMLLSIPTIFLGINLFLPTHYVAYAFYSAWVLLALVILIVNEIQIGQRSEQKDWDTNTKKPRDTEEVKKARRNAVRNFLVFMGISIVLIAGLSTIIGTTQSGLPTLAPGMRYCD